MSSEESCKNPLLCANGCGFFGSSATRNLCSKCYRDYLFRRCVDAMKADVDDDDKAHESGTTTPSPAAAAGGAPPAASPRGREPAKRRCSRCNKKVGLAGGFKCRCGGIYCASHRYAEEHDCAFDYKSSGRNAIAQANPAIRTDKIEKM